MTNKLSRRGFLRGTLASSAAVVSLSNSSMVHAKSNECATPFLGKTDSLYGPDPRNAHLVYNENPFGPSPKALEAITNACGQGAYYQGKSIDYLAEMIAEENGVSAEQVLISNGSYEALTAIAIYFSNKGNTLAPDLFWDTTAKYTEAKGMNEINRVAMTDSLEIDLDALKSTISEDTALVHIVNPNNPTGRLIPAKELRSFCKEIAAKTTVLIDEAYIELTDDPDSNSMIDLLQSGNNVIIARTFSKIYGLAGLRVGYTMMSAELAEKIRPYLVSVPNIAGIAAAIASYKDKSFLDSSKSRLVEAREMITEGARANDLNPLPSQTSFVFIDTGKDANLFQQSMEEKGIVIRRKYGNYHNFSRVSCGYSEDVKRFINAIPYALET